MTIKLKSIALVAGASLLASAAQAAVYSNNFNVADGTTNFGDGSTAQGNNAGGGFTAGNQLRLTTSNVGGTNAALTVPALANSSLGWTATFDYTMIANGGFDPADGWSFNYGNIPLGTFSPANPEEGWAPGSGTINYVAACVDTWQNNNAGDLPDVTINTNIGGVNSVLADQDGNILNFPSTISGAVSITYNPATGLSFSTTGLLNNAAFSNVALPGFVPGDAFTFGIGARTGGATQDLLIDNLNITTVPEASSSLLALLAGFGLLSIRRRK